MQFLFNGLYQLLWALAPAYIRHYLNKRARRAPLYSQNWHERFGGEYSDPVKNCIWVHAVSVGETRAAQPLINALSKEFPHTPLLITQMTPTGRQTAQDLFPDAQIRYLPYDKKSYVEIFLKQHQPVFGVLMETEIWPNLVQACAEQKIPLFLANARLSQKSFDGYKKVRPLVQPALERFTLICAQSKADQNRLQILGAKLIEVCGNTKYDVIMPDAMHELAKTFHQRIGTRQVVVCASTRKGEEALLLTAWQMYQGDALLVIIPRHPERFDEVYQEARAFYCTQKRSDGEALHADTQVWIGDSMGELFAYYLCADVVFVGGSLVDTGCQNILEPLQCGKPTLFGFSTFNFQQISEDALSAQAAIQILTPEQWAQKTQHLLSDATECQQLSKQALYFIDCYTGASKKITSLIEKHLPEKQTDLL